MSYSCRLNISSFTR